MNFVETLSKEKFEHFMNCLTLAGNYITDIEIVDGRIRQPNKLNTVIFEMNMTQTFNRSLDIPNSKNKLPIMKLISEDGGDVMIEMDGDVTHACYIKSGKTSFKFNQAESRLFDTHFVNDEKFDQHVTAFMGNDNLLLSLPFESLGLRKKVLKVTRAFSNKEIRVTISKNGNSMEIFSDDKVQSCVIHSDNHGRDMNSKYTLQLPVDFMDCDEKLVAIEFYKPYVTKDNPENPNKIQGQSFARCRYQMASGQMFNLYVFCFISSEPDNSQWNGNDVEEEQPVVEQEQPAPQQAPEPAPQQPVFSSPAEKTAEPESKPIEAPPVVPETTKSLDEAFDEAEVPGLDDFIL